MISSKVCSIRVKLDKVILLIIIIFLLLKKILKNVNFPILIDWEVNIFICSFSKIVPLMKILLV